MRVLKVVAFILSPLPNPLPEGEGVLWGSMQLFSVNKACPQVVF
jgi:hypothetical protein